MFSIKSMIAMALVAITLGTFGCSDDKNDKNNTDAPVAKPATNGVTYQNYKITDAKAEGITESCRVSFSPYSAWSVSLAMDATGAIAMEKGKVGQFERDNNVDIEMADGEYVATLNDFAAGKSCAVMTTNIDALTFAGQRQTVVFMPTSRSQGADALYVDSSIQSWDDLKMTKVYVLHNSVSYYVLMRVMEQNGQNPADFTLVDAEPPAILEALKNGSAKAGMLWNPEGNVLRAVRGDTIKKFADSGTFDEVYDLVAMGADVANTERGQRTRRALVGAYYATTARVVGGDDLAQRATLRHMVGTYQKVGPRDMPIILKETPLYTNPAEAAQAFTGDKWQRTMDSVVKLSQKTGLVDSNKTPTISFDPKIPADITFDTRTLQALPAGTATK